jgi:multiple sugar transport system ATP-binding protein
MIQATKIQKYVIEPKSDGFSEEWESFHATNPSSMRLPEFPGVFLAYRAGGSKDRFFLFDKYVWNSNMGLAILDEKGEEVVYRFPLPIFKKDRKVDFPQSLEEFNRYQLSPHKDDLVVFHDFRFFFDKKNVYVLTHEGALTWCLDTIFKVKRHIFIKKVEESIELIKNDAVTKESWGAIWYDKPVFLPCGYGGTNKVYASSVNKNDIVMLNLLSGKTQICHRICPDYGVFETKNQYFFDPTPDGITKYGCLENCARPGYFDNSHVGNNGNPILVKIGENKFFMDIVHGVHNESLSIEHATKNWDMTYLPFFRLKDAYTGQTVYYGEEPILQLGETWREYVENGPWVSKLDHLRGVMFPGGQVAKDPKKIDENSEFTFYTGVGDSAVARADFKMSDFLSEDELDNLRNYNKIIERRKNIKQRDDSSYICSCGDFSFFLRNVAGQVAIHREFIDKNGNRESSDRIIQSSAGYFDFVGAETNGLFYKTEYGFVVPVKGYSYHNGQIACGYGLYILKHDNPEKIYYRSTASIAPCADDSDMPSLDALLASVPEKVKFEILKTEEFIKEGKTFESDLTRWMLQKTERKSRDEIELRHINKIYDNNVQAVFDFNLRIEEGEFVVFVGPSGCGKSTTLRMIAGLEEITDGELFINGEIMNDVEPKDRHIAMVFQNYALYPHMTVFNNMAFSLKMMKHPMRVCNRKGEIVTKMVRYTRQEIVERVNKAAKMLDLTDYLTRKPRALSGGQRQRVALGRAIVRDAKVFLMDEPLSNLDAKLRVQMRSELINLHNELKNTIIYVTHDQIEAMTMADRIVVMKDGFIMQVGKPKFVYNNPANEFVATFIGTPAMNLIAGEIDNEGNFHVDGGPVIKLPEDKFEDVKKVGLINKPAKLGIRAEDFSEEKEKLAEYKTHVSVDIKMAELIGSTTNAHFNIGSSKAVASLSSSSKAKRGAEIELAINMRKCHIFDAETTMSVTSNNYVEDDEEE